MGVGAVALSLTGLSLLLSTGACSQIAGSRCDPALSHDECDNSPTVQCVTPAGQGNSYCCAVTTGYTASAGDPGVLIGPDGTPGGYITDTAPNCQSVPTSSMGGYTCPLGSPYWYSTGCSDTPYPADAGETTDDASESDASESDASESDAEPTSDAGEGGSKMDGTTVVEASSTAEASVEASTVVPEAAVEASVVSDATAD
jgi:hypothetical protein